MISSNEVVVWDESNNGFLLRYRIGGKNDNDDVGDDEDNDNVMPLTGIDDCEDDEGRGLVGCS